MGLFTKKPRPLTVRYEAKATDGGLDQVLTMTNSTDTDLVPVLRFRPLDFYGRELPLVTVTSLQGLTRGQVVVPSNSVTKDVLRFEGPGCRSVRFVDTEVVDLVEIEVAGLDTEPTTVMVDLDKKATANPEDFWGIGVANANDAEMRVRVTLVALEPAELLVIPAKSLLASSARDCALLRLATEQTMLALERSQGKVFGTGGAAELLAMKPTTVASRIKKFQIDLTRFKQQNRAS